MPVTLFAQFTDDFEDGDITNWTQSTADRWAASDISPLNGSYSLHHIFDNPDAGHDQVTVSLSTLDLTAQNTSWRFIVKHTYDPSSSNNWSAFLVSDAEASEIYPSGSANGYALGVNYTGTDDTLRLWKITGGSASVVITCNLNWQMDIGTSNAVAIEVIRSTAGDWEVKYNIENNFNNLAPIGTGTDNTYTTAEYCGFYYEYSASYDRRLWVDDIYVGEEIIDMDPPTVSSVKVQESNNLLIEFSEQIDSIIAVNPLNYLVNNSIGRPSSVSVDESKKFAELIFTSNFSNGQTYEITIDNIEDLEGNAMSETKINFLYYIPQPYDLVINEIMADPNPVVNLPDIEYIEIFNTSDFDINIAGWTYKAGTSIRNFPSVKVNSNEYYIVCDEDDEAEFTGFGNVITVDGSLSLTNSGQTLSIRNESGVLISRVIYTEDWYQDDYKAEGGWSLEQIDPLNPCGEENNWKASVSETGGTPGQENSIYASNPDVDAPELLRIAVLSENSIQLFFNESLERLSAMSVEIYSVDQSIGNPTSINIIEPDFKSLTLDFANSFNSSLVYTLEISGGITDCAGNEIADKNSARFAIPVDFEENDVVINEILFNPIPDGSDFIEIYNRSDKTFDLKDLRIATLDIETGEYSGIENITNEGFLIFPADYIVITEDVVFIQEQYYTSNPEGFIEADLASMNDDNGIVLLLNKSLEIIDKLSYDEDMQFSLLATKEGVSLERINYNRPSDDKTNWHSASELVGFATPAYENSQFLDEDDIVDEVTVVPEVFSPDNDGFEDVTNINFLLDEPGYVANIKIFDSKGRMIRYLANNQLLGIEGVITWDGLDDKNQKAPVGIYVVYIEIFDLDGNVKQFKKPVVVAARL